MQLRALVYETAAGILNERHLSYQLRGVLSGWWIEAAYLCSAAINVGW